MYDDISGCGCGTSDCCSLPAEFVRVRYFFGQRLGVMELNDEAMYHAGKQAFHNARLHGAGVLCGLRAERYEFTRGAPTTVLRVRKGAALDLCGREIIVGADQCIDVAAWFARNRARAELRGWTAGTRQSLWVGLRYRECPSDPSPAPRDPCGCDNGGCEYGRVREGFELALLTDGELAKFKQAPFPPTEKLLAALATGDDAQPAAIDALVAADCPDPVDDPWLCLAALAVTVDASGVPADISDPDNQTPLRTSLLSTAALQSTVLDLAMTAAADGVLGDGPRLGRLEFKATGAAAGTLTIRVTLAETGSPAAPVALVGKTFDPSRFEVRRLDKAAGWDPAVPLITTNPVYQSGPPARIDIPLSKLAAGELYRVTFDPSFDAPVADALGRPLRPLRFARTFALVSKVDPNTNTTTLQLDPTV